MIKSLKELKKSIDGRMKEKEIVRDEEGRAVIEMTVRDDGGMLSPYSAGTRPMLGADVAEYLQSCALPIPPKEPLSLKIYSDCIDDGEKAVYTQALRDYFYAHYCENALLLRRNALVSLLMTIVGVLALTVGIVFGIFEWVPVLGEVLDIFAWVFLWEAVDQFFLERAVLRLKSRRYLRFADAKVIYSEIQKTPA